MASDLTGETVELLQTLIRNQCVNDGTAESGFETRNADVLQTYVEGSGVDIERWEPTPGRASFVARIPGSDPAAPSLCLMGHTDVVPVTPAGWRHDPFGGELIDGEVWGRGAVDMLNLTSSMAVVFRSLVRRGFRPKGDLLYFAVADEEAGSAHGARWVAREHPDAIRCDYLLTESGGLHHGNEASRSIDVMVGEKGVAWRRLRVHGTPGHGSMPYGSDNALVTAAKVVSRLAEYRPDAAVPRVVARAGGVARAVGRHDRRPARRVGDRRAAGGPAGQGVEGLPPRLHAHHVLAERGRHQGSAQDQRDPRPRRHRRRRAHDARRAHRRSDRAPPCGAR